MTDLRNLLIEQLEDLYDAEQQIVEILPKMAEAASEDELRTAFQDHLEESHRHVERLEQAFSKLDRSPSRKTCKGIRGIIAEGEEDLKRDLTGPSRDALLIASAQRVEHYEIAGYGTVVAWADVLDLDDIGALLGETLDEEAAADDRLTTIAEGGLISSGVNEEAMAR